MQGSLARMFGDWFDAHSFATLIGTSYESYDVNQTEEEYIVPLLYCAALSTSELDGTGKV
jgi:hypothetical protein